MMTKCILSLLVALTLLSSLTLAAVATAGETIFTEAITFDAKIASHTPSTCNPTTNFNLIGPEWASFPVTYKIDVSKAPADVKAGAAAEINAGFEAWEGITSIPNFFQVSTSSRNKVQFRNIDGPSGILAQVQIFSSFGVFTRFTMTFDAGDNWEIFGGDVCPTPDGLVGFDIREVAAHEAGHVVGLHHSTECAACGNQALTMYPFILDQGETYKRSPESGDRLGMQFLYP